MRWRKLGRIFAPDGTRSWARSHATVPTPLLLGSHAIRVFFASLDETWVGRIGYVDLDARDPTRVLDQSGSPVLDVGEPGAFDEHGVNAASVVRASSGEIRLYYFGFQRLRSLPYLLFAGLAISEDEGRSFTSRTEAPLIDRVEGERLVRSAPHVLAATRGFRMWYVSGDRFVSVGTRLQPTYCIRTLVSADGVRWTGPGQVAVSLRDDGDEYGLGRPWVVQDGSTYRMWYSRRTLRRGYRLGYAESVDGVSWRRLDDQVGIDVSPSGWDAEMICYPAVVETAHGAYLFYNGNGYGRSGFGVAVLES